MSVARDSYIAGLKVERAHHESLGNLWNVAMIDDELARMGVRTRPEQVNTAAQGPMERAVPQPDEHRCDECGRTFTTARGLGSHSRVHA